jgi:transposase
VTENTLFVGLDVDKKTISVAVADDAAGAAVRFHGTIENTPAAVRNLCKKLAKAGRRLHCCYEAGPCGYGCSVSWLGSAIAAMWWLRR